MLFACHGSGWSPSVPEDGYDLAPGTAEYEQYERAGLRLAGQLGFVVPAGGLGERLGYRGVKFALPSEISTGASVLRVCARARAVRTRPRPCEPGMREPGAPPAVMTCARDRLPWRHPWHRHRPWHGRRRVYARGAARSGAADGRSGARRGRTRRLTAARHHGEHSPDRPMARSPDRLMA